MNRRIGFSTPRTLRRSGGFFLVRGKLEPRTARRLGADGQLQPRSDPGSGSGFRHPAPEFRSALAARSPPAVPGSGGLPGSGFRGSGSGARDSPSPRFRPRAFLWSRRPAVLESRDSMRILRASARGFRRLSLGEYAGNPPGPDSKAVSRFAFMQRAELGRHSVYPESCLWPHFLR